jgi:hypothetical protein
MEHSNIEKLLYNSNNLVQPRNKKTTSTYGTVSTNLSNETVPLQPEKPQKSDQNGKISKNETFMFSSNHQNEPEKQENEEQQKKLDGEFPTGYFTTNLMQID